MDSRKKYHESILKRYLNKFPKEICVDGEFQGMDGLTLKYTEIQSETKIGIIIIPGITVPRESYYKLLVAFSDLNVLVFDIRGQAFSEGELNPHYCAQDINLIGQEFKNRRNLEFLIGVGHSFGALALLFSSLDEDHPYNLRISLAAPADMKKVSGKIPERATSFLVYVHNIYRTLRFAAFRDEIVRQYQPYWPPKFLKDPRIVSLRIKDPRPFNDTLITSPKLIDFMMNVASPIYLIYAGADTRLGIKGEFADDYVELNRLASKKGFEFSLIDGLSHRFNIGNEKEFVLSYDNDIVIKKIREILNIHSF